MSYILDALKKAEADRDPDARASLAMAQHERRRNRWLIYAAVIALIANAAVLLWLFFPDQEQQAAGPAAQQQNAQGEATETQPARQPQSPITQPTAAPPRSEAAARRETPTQQTPTGEPPTAVFSPKPAPTYSNTMAAETATGETIIGPGAIGPGAAAVSTSTPVDTEVLPVSSLPSGQRARFPILEFSTHIYADEADLRAIVVNGTRLQEGDRLGSLRLEEITEQGAVFHFEDRLVSVSVLDAWN